MYPPVITSKDLTLKAYHPDDEEAFMEMTSDEYHRVTKGYSESHMRGLFKKGFELYKRNDERWFWVWGIYKNDSLCGHLELKDSENTNADELEVVYAIHEKERRKGIMTEVLTMLKQKQKDWDRKIIATVALDNEKSLELLRKKIGVEKEELITDEDDGYQYFKLTLK